ncbi:hypothetical protein [Brevibacillus laterosporus]|uniref:hypothetical protein n=1 Tax=Brevibacillus laterosporus TaxID=1465 RepID=UPI002653C83E|nr:hypothetical protein [Brevibacillus laterosporus]MDN9012899.1 hypothetical protein [Brevibacillus laterosporus]MDO0944006.1 hypothetical protein [Brevibacillus laterosporus]
MKLIKKATFGVLAMSLLAIAAPASQAEAFYCKPSGYNQPQYCLDETDFYNDPSPNPKGGGGYKVP